MIYVDQPIWPRGKKLYAHLISDLSFDELHAFAAELGMSRRSFHRDHYDLPKELHGAATVAGAAPIDARLIPRTLRAAGLRRPAKRRKD